MRGTLKEVRTALVFLLRVAFLRAPFTFPTLPCALPHPRRAWRTDPVRADQCALARSSLCAPLLGSAPPAVLPGCKERVRRPGIPHPSQDLLHSPSFPSPVCTESRPGAAGGTQPRSRQLGGCGHGPRRGHSMGASVPPPARRSGPAGADHNGHGPHSCALSQSAAPRRPLPCAPAGSKLSSTGCSRLNCLLYVLLTFI